MTAGLLRRSAPLPPPLFIVGHWRSGTTHLYNVLSRSPAFGYVPPIATGLPWEMLGLARLLRPLLERALPPERFVDSLKHWEARFHRVTLEDRNLPVIAQKRLLSPVSEATGTTLDAAFEEFAGRRQDVLETLLGSTGERAMFRQVYPFSPALVQTLIAVSSLLQRERTALKLRLQLLVDRRGELELGMVIPVGDLWDVIAEGDEPFTEGTRLQFENAKKLWTQKLLPLLERHHGVSWQELQEGAADPDAALALRNDARLLKTLLLAELVPEVEALKALIPSRLAALNYGSARSPLASARP